MKVTQLRIAAASILIATIALTPFALKELSKAFIVQGVQVADLNLGGMNYTQANIFLNEQYDQLLDKEVKITFNNIEYKTKLRNLGVEFDAYKTTEDAYSSSHGEGGAWEQFSIRIQNLFSPTRLTPKFTVNKDAVEKEIRRLIPQMKNPENAHIEIAENGSATVVSETDGMTTNFTQIQNQIQNSLLTLKVPAIDIVGEKVEAKYTLAEANDDAAIWSVLLEQEIHFTLKQGDIDIDEVLTIKPEWVSVKRKTVTFHREEIEKYLEETFANKLYKDAAHATIKSIPEDSAYAEVEGIAHDGQKLNAAKTTDAFIANAHNEVYTTEISVDRIAGTIINETDSDLGPLEFLSQGRSNFKGSPKGREFNIHKGIEEKINNILLAPGETYSFNSNLGPVTNAAGWQDSLAIFGGKDLRPVPGGGLCQTSTTVYRAALYAGLNVIQQYNHSLYVHYYRDFGDGLDSTIYPGVKDLQFVNDSPNYVLIQAYVDGNDVYVNMYGQNDGRSTKMYGPFYAGKVPEEFKSRVSVGSKDIVWIREITRPDGSIEEEILRSRYRTKPY